MRRVQRYLGIAAVCGFLGVAMGAFGAHALQGRLEPYAMAVYKTGIEYQMWHTLALALVAVLLRSDPASSLLVWTARLLIAGIILFSGSLTLLSMTGIRWFGAITPLGGTAWLIAWLLLGFYSYRSSGKKRNA